MLEIRHLRSLKAIAETDKLANAAERVHLTQSALSHQIRALESHYDITLFQRTAYGLRFTPVGERLLQLAELVLEATAQAERDLTRLKLNQTGELRIVLECHTCFDWLTPVMDTFRRAWPEVELDLVAGFHSDPWGLIKEGKADFVIGGPPSNTSAVKSNLLQHIPLFKFEILAVLPNDHALQNKPYVKASDFTNETLITYPVPDDRIDIVSRVLAPKGIVFNKRTAELTIAIMQLVASHRGLAALPSWGVQSYIEHEYITAKPIEKTGLWSELYATGKHETMERAYAIDLIRIIQTCCLERLDGIKLF